VRQQALGQGLHDHHQLRRWLPPVAAPFTSASADWNNSPLYLLKGNLMALGLDLLLQINTKFLS
jgi:hypothetical protein